MKKCVCILLIALLSACMAQEVKNVLGRGYGTTVDSAIQNALADAIRKSVGAIVDEKTVVENDELIEEKIISLSNGIVQKYEIVNPPKLNMQGLHVVTIRAMIKSNFLVQQLQKVNIVKGTVDNGEEIWRNTMAQIVTEAKKKEDTQKILGKLFDSIQAEKYAQVTLFDKDGNLNENAKLDIVPMKEQKQARVTIFAIISVDRKRYFEELFPYIQQTLEYACDIKSESMWTDGQKTTNFIMYAPDHSKVYIRQFKNTVSPNNLSTPSDLPCDVFFEDMRYGMGEIASWTLKNMPRNNKEKKTAIILQTNARMNQAKQRYSIYIFNSKIALPKRRVLDYVFRIYDKRNEVVTEYKQSNSRQKGWGTSMIIDSGYPAVDNREAICLTPGMSVFQAQNAWRLDFSYNIPVVISFDVPLSDIKDFDHFEMQIQMSTEE